MIVDKGIHLVRLARLNAPVLAVLFTYDALVTVACWFALALGVYPRAALAASWQCNRAYGHRSNGAYGYWWEARTLWGAMMNNSRSLARGVFALADDRDLSHNLIRSQIAYVLALRCHLLRQPINAALERYLPPDVAAACRQSANVPTVIQLAMARRVAAHRDTRSWHRAR
jgi:putative membrane protein